ncbi:hypothetical protein ACSSNL_18055 [Thalassobius sp. S69A]|uniref:hypothetical protein n=1 Tax=unclassified Thalassovita TaxID=2619711 RepID=UPI003C7DEDBF
MTFKVVPKAGLEPARLAAGDFETLDFPIKSMTALVKIHHYRRQCAKVLVGNFELRDFPAIQLTVFRIASILPLAQ